MSRSGGGDGGVGGGVGGQAKAREQAVAGDQGQVVPPASLRACVFKSMGQVAPSSDEGQVACSASLRACVS